MKAVLEGLKALGPARLAAMAAVALGMFGLLALLAFRGNSERMALLYSDLDMREAGQMVEQLDRQHIGHALGAGGTQILVPSDQVAQARLLLAKEGLPSGGSVGYELFDRADGLTASQFQQNINQTRALEGELSRSIRAINGVRAARVHLVLPRREPFSRQQQDAQASVVLTMTGPARLDREGTLAIKTLVGAAVPGLRPTNVAIVDSRGNVLAQAGEPDPATASAQNADALRRATEARLARAVEQMLERSLGAGRVRAEANVDMDFEQVRETQERFDPDGQVVRSTQTSTDNNKTTEANPSVSVQNNLPNADAGTNPTGTQDQRQDETTNYEIGKTVRTIVREQPQIRRVSLAVLIDGVEERKGDGPPVWRERTPDEIERIAKLVRGAIGYDEKRGDHVEVVTMRFAAEDGATGAEPNSILGMVFEKADLLHLAQTLVLALVGLLALLMVLRPMVLRLTTNPTAALGADASATGADMLGGSAGNFAGGALSTAMAGANGVALLEGPSAGGGAGGMAAGGSVGAITGPGGVLVRRGGGETDDDSMVEVSNFDGQIRASSIRRLTELVEKHPEESLSIMRAWMQQEPA
jgi:flagellar M-ring protein FliF